MAHPENLIGRFPRFAELAGPPWPAQRRGVAARGRAALRPRGDARPPGPVQAGLVRPRVAGATIPALRALIAKGRGYDEEDKRRPAPSASGRCWPRSSPPIAAAADAGPRRALAPRPTTTRSCRSSATATRTGRRTPARYVPRRFRHPEDAADQIRRAIDRHTPAVRPAARGHVAVRGLGLGGGGRWRWRAPACAGRPPTRASSSAASSGPLHRDSRGTGRTRSTSSTGPGSAAPRAGDDRACCSATARVSDLIGFSYSGSDPEHAAARPARAHPARSGEPWSRDGPGRRAGGADHPGRRERLGALPRRRPRLPAPVYRGLQADPAPAGRDHERGAGGRRPARDAARLRGELDPRGLLGVDRPRRRPARLGPAGRRARRAERGGDRRRGSAPEALERARESSAPRAGSDWCWWYGDDRSSENDFEFDRLFRRHLRAVYASLGRPAPEASRGDAHHHAPSARCGRAGRRGDVHARPRRRDHARGRVGGGGRCIARRSPARCTGARRASAPSASAWAASA